MLRHKPAIQRHNSGTRQSGRNNKADRSSRTGLNRKRSPGSRAGRKSKPSRSSNPDLSNSRRSAILNKNRNPQATKSYQRAIRSSNGLFFANFRPTRRINLCKPAVPCGSHPVTYNFRLLLNSSMLEFA